MSHAYAIVVLIVVSVLLVIVAVVFPWVMMSLTDQAAKERWFSWQLILIYATAYLMFGYLLYEMAFRSNSPLWLIIMVSVVGVVFVAAWGNVRSED